MGHTLFKHKAEQGYKYTAPESLLSRGCIFMALFGVSRTSRICEANSRWLSFVSDGSFTWNCIKFPKFRYFPEKGLTEVT